MQQLNMMSKCKKPVTNHPGCCNPSPCSNFRFLVSTADEVGGARDTGPWVISNNGEIRFVAEGDLDVTSTAQNGITYVTYSVPPPPEPIVDAFSIYVPQYSYEAQYNGPLSDARWQDGLIAGNVTSTGAGAVTIGTGIWKFALTYTLNPVSPDDNILTSSSSTIHLGLSVVDNNVPASLILSANYATEITGTPDQYTLTIGITSGVSDVVQITEPATLQVIARSNASGTTIPLGVSTDSGSTNGVIFSGHRLGNLPPLP